MCYIFIVKTRNEEKRVIIKIKIMTYFLSLSFTNQPVIIRGLAFDF